MAEARRRSLRVLRAVCGSAASLLGPVQALKALEDDTEPRLVADALGVLEILDVQHPIAQLLREAVFAQHAAHGSGTTQLMALIGALCVEAEALERAGLPPAAIAHGFAEAAERCLATADELAVDTDQLLDAGAATEDDGPSELPTSPTPSVTELPLFASHQFQPKLAAEIENADDDVGWFFAEDDISMAVESDARSALPSCFAMDSLASSAFAETLAVVADAPASTFDGRGNCCSPALHNCRSPQACDSLLATGHSSVSIYQQGTASIGPARVEESCRCSAWHYIGPAACDVRLGTCSACRITGRASKGSVWNLRSWRALRCAATGLHHGHPQMMELALVAALLLAVDSQAVREATDSSSSSSLTGSASSSLLWLGVSQVCVMRMLGGADMTGGGCLNVASTGGQSGSGHYIIAGLVLPVAAPDSSGQLHNIRAAMRVHHSVQGQSVNHAGLEPTATRDTGAETQPNGSRNIIDDICCATVDGSIPSPGDELSQAQVCEILDFCCQNGGDRIGLLAASGTVDPQVVHWCAARGVIVLDNMPRHSFHKLVSLCGSRALHSFRRIKPTHVSQQLLRLELWEQRGWYCGTGSPCPEDKVAAANSFQMPKSNMLAVSVAQKSSLLTQPGSKTASNTVYARGVKPHVTVVLCASTDAAATLYEAGFWKCLSRLRSTLATGKVLPGAGCFELYAAEALRCAQVEQEQQYALQHQQQCWKETDRSNSSHEAPTSLIPQGADCTEALLTCLAYGGFQRALEHIVRRALQNYQAPSHADVCERLERASAVVQSRMRTKGDSSLLPLPWHMWNSSCPLLYQHQPDADAAGGSTRDTSASLDQSHEVPATDSSSEPEYELVLDDLEAKRGALRRAAGFLRVCLLTDVVDLQTLL